MGSNETLNMTIITLAITMVAALAARSLMSLLSLFRMASIALMTFSSNIEEVYEIMMKKLTKFGIASAALLIMAAALMPALSLSAGATTPKTADQQVLQLRYDNVNAHVVFMTSYMGDIMKLVPQASDLQAPTDKLNSDMTTLQGYVSSNDNKGFSDYVKGTVTPDVKAAQAAIKADQGQFKAWNVTADTRKELKSDFQALKTQYENQVNSTKDQLYSTLLNDRISNDNAAIQKNDGVISNMSGKGYDVSGMQAVQSAGRSVVSKLQSAQGSDPATIKDMLKSECLGNGATYSEHYFAEFDLARLQAISAKLSPTVAASNSTAAQQAFATANSDLSSVSGLLQSINHQPYSGGQQDQVWGDGGLKGASQSLKTVIDDLKASKTQG